MADIFLSYSSKDKERIKPLVKLFEQQGWSVWWDDEIPVGDVFSKVIKTEIANSKCMVVVWSHASVQSFWVETEAEAGRVRGILLPVLIDNVEIPFGFNLIQTANLTDWKGEKEHSEFVNLLQKIYKILGQPIPQNNQPEQTEEQLPPPTPSKTQTLGQRITNFFKENLVLAVFSAALLIFVAAFVISSKFLSRNSQSADNLNANNYNANINTNVEANNITLAAVETVRIPAEQRAMAIVNIFEGDRPQGRYSYKYSFEEGDIVNYGRSGAKLKEGTLYTLIKAYCNAPNAKFKDAFKPYLERLAAKDTSLANDSEFVELLKAAGGEDPIMIAVQDQDYDNRLWKPSVARAQELGIKTQLGIAAVYDAYVHIGQQGFERLKNQTRDYFEGTPITGVNEREWIKKFLEVRKEYLLNHRILVIRKSAYRVNELLKLVEKGNWELKAPITIRGFEITD